MGAQTRIDKQIRPEFSVTKGSDLPLSGRSLVAILRAVLEKGAPARFQAKGFSMSPFIKNNDVVTISPLKGKRPGLGEIIAFVHRETGGLCVHRIVRKEGAFYITKGDNIAESAESVPAENILGLVARVERGGKEVFLCLGPERYLVALLGRRGLLFPLLLPVWRVVRPIFKRTAG
jgi:signal peptidase I